MTLLEQTIRELLERQIPFQCTTHSSGGAVIRNTSLFDDDAFRISFLNHNSVIVRNNKNEYLKDIDDVINKLKPFIDYEN